MNVVAASCARGTTGNLGSRETAADVGKPGYAATAIRKRRGWFIRLANGSRPALRRESMSACDVAWKKCSDLRRVPIAGALGFAAGVRVPAAMLTVVAAIFAVAPGIAEDALRKTAVGSTATGTPKPTTRSACTGC